MRNRHVTEFIDEYLHGGMDHAARAAVDAHLEACPTCRQALDSAVETSQVMRWLPNPAEAPKPGPDFYYRVQAAIEQQQSQGWLTSWTAALQPRLALPFVAMGVLLLAWVISLPQRGSAITTVQAEGWEEVEYPADDFAQMTYSDDGDEERHDRMMDDLVELPDTPANMP